MYLVIDLSSSMEDQDLRPTRLISSLKVGLLVTREQSLFQERVDSGIKLAPESLSLL